MDLVQLLIVLIVFGAVIYIAGLLPIDGTVKTIIKVIAIVALVIWLLRTFAPALTL
jgi:hypothetical protein